MNISSAYSKDTLAKGVGHALNAQKFNMTNLGSVSQVELKTRRRQLRSQRRLKAFQSIWRTIALSGLTGTIVWVTTLPDWVIRKPEQIVIEGNQFLSAPAIRAMLPIKYPQSLLKLQPQEIALHLESSSPIASATVSRQLLPPGLTIQVKERQPVALAQLPGTSNLKNASNSSSVGLLDEEGIWLPLQTYTARTRSLKLTNLKVIGYPQQYRPYWRDIYQTVHTSPVKVSEIDLQNPANLILKTELGNVHFGPYSSRFPEQMRALDRLRQLPRQIKSGQIAYINLKNAESPSIQITKVEDTVKAHSN